MTSRPGPTARPPSSRASPKAAAQITGSVRIALKTADYLPYFQKVKDANPDVIYVFNPGGPQATAFMKAFDDVGIVNSKIKLIGPSDITSDDELPNMGRSALGVITLGQYSPAATRPSNLDFVAAWKKEYGAEAIPTYFAIAGWDGMQAIFDVIKAQKGKIDPDETMKLLHSWSNPNSPRGPVRIDEAGDIVQTLYMRRVEEKNGKIENIEYENAGEYGDPWKTFNK